MRSPFCHCTAYSVLGFSIRYFGISLPHTQQLWPEPARPTPLCWSGGGSSRFVTFSLARARNSSLEVASSRSERAWRGPRCSIKRHEWELLSHEQQLAYPPSSSGREVKGVVGYGRT